LSAPDGAGYVLAGGVGDAVIHGGMGDDVIYGGTGNDTLSGGDGNDIIHSGAGNNTLYGGAGEDIFAFDFSKLTSGSTDIIKDFSLGEDKVNLGDLFGQAETLHELLDVTKVGDAYEAKWAGGSISLALGPDAARLDVYDDASGHHKTIVLEGGSFADLVHDYATALKLLAEIIQTGGGTS